jgi:hypothetical protein
MIIVLATLLTSGVASRVSAQTSGNARRPRIQPEARVDYIDARASAAHLGVGISVPASTYVRLGIVGAAGQAWSNGSSMAAGRVDGLVRFVVDPLREFRWAPYASGGLGAIYDESEQWRAVLVGVLGVEGPSGGGLTPAIEVGFGGGARVGVTLRRSMPGRR